MDFQEDLMKLKPILSRASFRMRINIVYALLHLLAIAGIALGIGAVSNRLLKNETQNNLKQNIALASERLDALLDKIENASLHFTVTLPENCTDIWISPDIGARALNNANLYPSNRKIQIGDKMSVTSGFSGGLTSRAGYVVKDHSQLPDKVNNYLERLAKPYYAAAAAWLEQIHIGMSGGELYDIIKRVLPQEVYHWNLNPGHLCAEEEWLCSPIYENSQIQLKSGMILQLDIIPSIKGYGGTGAENGIALADARLRADIKEKYPILWQRFVRRRTYMREVLHLNLHDEVLPLSDTTGYYHPFFLDKTRALVLKQT